MGVDIYFTVERRQEDERWQRAENLEKNKFWWMPEEMTAGTFDWSLIDEELPLTLRQPYIHDRWQTLDARNRWLQYMNLPAKGLPEDVTLETSEYLQYYTEESGRSFLTLRELEALDWAGVAEAAWYGDVTFVLSIRDDLLSRLRSLGGPDDVRIVYGWNI